MMGFGLVYASVCVPAEMPVDDVLDETNREWPTGLDWGWRISTDSHFATGHEHPCPCDQITGRVHRLLEC